MSSPSEELQQTIRKACYDHLVFIMKNKGLFLQNSNFSTVQYMNERMHINAYKFNTILMSKLATYIGADKSYLNMGATVGWLPWVANHTEGCENIRIDNVEWDEQIECCEVVRNSFGINISYTCNNVKDEDFVIRDINEVYDYVILQRFFPIYHTSSPDELLGILKKFKPYAKKAIVVEAENNWSDGQYEVLLANSQRRINLSSNWQLTVTDLEKL